MFHKLEQLHTVKSQVVDHPIRILPNSDNLLHGPDFIILCKWFDIEDQLRWTQCKLHHGHWYTNQSIFTCLKNIDQPLYSEATHEVFVSEPQSITTIRITLQSVNESVSIT